MIGTPFEIPIWFILLYLAIGMAGLAVSGFGTYCLISGKFDKASLMISAAILFVLIIPKTLNPYHWISILGSYASLVSLIGLTLTYLFIFGLVNFVYRLVKKSVLV